MGKVPGRLGEYLDECGRLLQVALDFTKPWEALHVALEARVGKAIILEAGTPLIKSYGVDSIRLLRSIPGSGPIIADTKTMDTGRLELSLAAEAGADAVTVLSLAPDETIAEMVDEGEKRGVAVIGDLIGHPNPIEGAKKLIGNGVHIVLFHIGIDVQKKMGITATSRADLVRRIKQEIGGVIAVAGGIKPGETSSLADAGADIVIIGTGITRAKDPRNAALEALKGLRPRCY
jgi:3-hexulose-6-phosphate synthase